MLAKNFETGIRVEANITLALVPFNHPNPIEPVEQALPPSDLLSREPLIQPLIRFGLRRSGRRDRHNW